MKKFENFSNCLKVLKKADFEQAKESEIYRTGIINQFNLTFEFSWKALQNVLRIHSVEGADNQTEFSFGIMTDLESVHGERLQI